MFSFDVQSRCDARFILAPFRGEGVNPLSEWRGRLSNQRWAEKHAGRAPGASGRLQEWLTEG
jgi:hypothetical protein